MSEILDLDKARERAHGAKPANPIVDALDALALALLGHGHTWTPRERGLYETAIECLTGEPQ